MNPRSLTIIVTSLLLLVMGGLLFLPQSPWSAFHSTRSSPQTSTNPLEATDPSLTATDDQAPPVAPELQESNWRTQVDAVLALYDQDHDAGRAKTALIITKVPGDKREVHLRLVLALDQIIQKDSRGEEAFQKARIEYQKLP